MEVVAEKKEFDTNKNSSSNALDPSSTLSTIANAAADKEAEDRERQARDLKAGFHPLKVGYY